MKVNPGTRSLGGGWGLIGGWSMDDCSTWCNKEEARVGSLEKNVWKSIPLYIEEIFFLFTHLSLHHHHQDLSPGALPPAAEQNSPSLSWWRPALQKAGWCRVEHCMTQDRLKNRCLGSRLADRLPVVPRLSSTDPWFFNLRRIFFFKPVPQVLSRLHSTHQSS